MDVIYTLKHIDNIAGKFVYLLDDKKIVAVNGSMGAGKTTFIQAVCRQMGVVEKMSSPTFSIIQQYKTNNGLLINHIDVYRLKDTEEAIQAGVEDALLSGDTCFIEWPEKILNILPFEYLDVCIETADSSKRRIVVKY